MKKHKKGTSGFTLIELLIVIGLLGALVALVLPALTGSREEALASVDDYNQAGTLRTLTQYVNLYGVLPSDMHTGLNADATFTTAADLMDLPPEAVDNYLRPGSAVQLTALQAQSLVDGGMAGMAYGDGLNVLDTEADRWVARVTNDWEQEDGEPFTFRGRTLEDLDVEGGSADGILVALFVTPTIDWESGHGSDADWSGGNMKLDIKLEGKCPIVVDEEFIYFNAFVKAFDDGSPAEFIGTACPEHGILNP